MKKLTSPPILALPRSQDPFMVDTNAFDRQIGSLLLQMQHGGQNKPIVCWLRSLTYDEHKYDTAHRECLAVIWAVLLIRPYLEGSQLTIRTDHDPLNWIFNLVDATSKLARWHRACPKWGWTSSIAL